MSSKIKCVVWDLDNTVWNGVLLEDENVSLKKNIIRIIKTLDERGILQSIASKNEYEPAMEKLKQFRLDEYFIYPQINWNSKAETVNKIAELINIGKDTIAFVDDQETEREEVLFTNPEVMVIDAEDYLEIPSMDRMIPTFITEDSRKRRQMYQSDISRKNEESEYTGSSEEFLTSLNMELKISRVKEEDLQRVEELTIRTHQLNSTGYTYSYDELRSFIDSKNHVFLVAELKDRFGEYGKIGIALMECNGNKCTIKLLLMSCRVMTKGIGTAMLVNIINYARENKKDLFAEFLQTDRNRVMYITYKFMGFEEHKTEGDKIMFRYASSEKRDYPAYLNIIT